MQSRLPPVRISNGQAWSGEVENALKLAHARNIRVYVIGVESTTGRFIPQLPSSIYATPEDPIHSAIDRRSLRAIAEAGEGEYYELGIDSDQNIALQIIADVQRRAQSIQREENFTELYWYFLAVAAGFVGLGTLLVKERAPL